MTGRPGQISPGWQPASSDVGPWAMIPALQSVPDAC